MSPLVHLGSWMCFWHHVPCLAWMAHKLACSSRPTRNTSPASCNALTAIPWNLKLAHFACTISQTSLWKWRCQMRSSIVVCYFWISLRALIFSTCSFHPPFSLLHLSYLSYLPFLSLCFFHLPHPLGICNFQFTHLSLGQGLLCFMCHFY